MRLRSLGPRRVPLFFESGIGFEGSPLRWRQEWGAYGSAMWADTLFTADSGYLELRVNDEQVTAGSYSIWGAAHAVQRGRSTHSIGDRAHGNCGVPPTLSEHSDSRRNECGDESLSRSLWAPPWG